MTGSVEQAPRRSTSPHTLGSGGQAGLALAEDAKAAKRLVVELAYKEGVGVDTISEYYGIPQSTVRSGKTGQPSWGVGTLLNV